MNRRQLLRAIKRGLSWAAVPAYLAFRPATAQTKKTKPGKGKPEEEEKKKSTLVSDVERFGRGRTRIALLLPDIEGPFRFAADAVLRGFQAAHRIDGQGITVRVVRIEEDNFRNARSVMRRLARQKFDLVVGPLTRASVNRLSAIGELPIRTLALNLPDKDVATAQNCVLFSLAVEFEGRSAARFAFAEAVQATGGIRAPRALAISEPNSLSQRGANAFMDAWQAFGGELETPITKRIRKVSDLGGELTNVRADVIFMAIDPQVLRKVRSIFSPELPIYGTSQLNVGALVVQENSKLLAAPELDGVRVVGMPWQLMPSHPAVLAYERSGRLPHLEMQRLYAFGIDSFRIARSMLEGLEQFELDGVTGQLVVDTLTDPRVLREPVLGEYRQGVLVPAYESAYGQMPLTEEEKAKLPAEQAAQPTQPAVRQPTN